MQNKFNIALIALLSIFCVGYLYFMIIEKPGEVEGRKKKIISVYNSLSLGMSNESVQKILNEHILLSEFMVNRFDQSKISKSKPFDSLWGIESRSKLFSVPNHWGLWLEFKNNKLIGIRIRTACGYDSDKPANSPPDKYVGGSNNPSDIVENQGDKGTRGRTLE